jgi:hypothetical protein
MLFAAFPWLELCQPPQPASSESLISSTTPAATRPPTDFYQPKDAYSSPNITDLTTDANRPALAAGLYVVPDGVLPSLIPNESPQEASYKPRPPACGAARDASADNYGRKLKPAAKKTRKTRQKTKKTLKKRQRHWRWACSR